MSKSVESTKKLMVIVDITIPGKPYGFIRCKTGGSFGKLHGEKNKKGAAGAAPFRYIRSGLYENIAGHFLRDGQAHEVKDGRREVAELTAFDLTLEILADNE